MKFLKSIAFISLSVFVIFVFNISKVYAGGTYFSMYNDTYDCLLNGDIKLDNSTYAPGSTMIITGHINSNNCSKAIVNFAEIQVSFNGGSTYGDIVVLVGAAGPGQGTKYWQVPTNSTPGLHTLYFYERQANLSGGYYTKYSTINYYVSTNSYDPFVVTGISNPVPVHSGDTVNGFWYGGPTSAFTSASCSVSASPGGLVKNFSNVAGGDFDYVVNGNTLFNLVCGVTGGTVSDQFNVTVDPTATISASPTTVGSDNKTTLTWNSNGNAQYCLITKTDSSGSSSTQEYPYGTKIESITSNTTFSAKCYNGYAYSNIPSVVVHPYTAVTATLNYYSPIKNLVDANNNETNGKSYLTATISGLSSGSCTLKNITNTPNSDIQTFNSNGTYNPITISSLASGENRYQIICTDGSTSNIVTPNGQSGTLEATNGTSCQIPVGGSSCSKTLTWTTTSPANSFTTKLYKDGVATSLSGNNSNGTVTVNYGTTPNYSTKNKIDGEGSNNNETVDNELASVGLSAECVSTAHWNLSTLQCESNSTPLSDLTAEGINPTGAFLNSPRSFTSTVINNGDVSTGANPFHTLFQVGIDQSAGGGGGGGVGLNNNKRSNSFWNFIFSKTQKVSAAPEYTIIGNYPTASAITDLGVGEISNVTSPNINFSSVGTYYMRACADKNSQSDIFGVITESDENNNCGDWVPVSVTPVPPVPAPDLTAYVPSTTAGIGGTQPLTYTTTVGKTLTFYSTISNEGSLTTGKSFQNSFQIQSDITQYIATPNPMPALANGAMATASKAIKFSNVGTYKIRACADIPPINPGVVSESDENNNCSEYATINVAEPNYPDLVASGITPTEVAVGVSTVFNATITNDPRSATAPAVSSNGKGFYNLLQWYDLDDPFETIHNVTGTDMISTPLLVGESAILSRRVTFSESGSYMVRVCADKSTIGDIGGTVDEGSNEGNNCGDWTIVRVGIGADLEPSAITPTTAIVGVDTSFYADIINKGNASALSSNGKGFFNLLQWYPADDPSMVIHNITSEELIATPFASGATETITRHMNFSNTGEYMARVCADLDTAETKNNLVVESNEGNNCGAWVLITVIKPSEPSGEITATDCEIEDGYSSCETKINWSITSPILGADTAVTTNLPNPYNTELVATGNSGTTTYKLEYTESPRTFYLYHNNIEPPWTDTASAKCKNGNWSEEAQMCLPAGSTGEDVITASDCEIPLNGSECDSEVKWYVANPIGEVPMVTSNYKVANSLVGKGASGTKLYPILHGTWGFFLYNGDGSGVAVKKTTATANCISGTHWDGDRNACVKNIDITTDEDGKCSTVEFECLQGDAENITPVNSEVGYSYWDCVGTNGVKDYCSYYHSGSGGGTTSGEVTLIAVPSWIFRGRLSTLSWKSWADAVCNLVDSNGVSIPVMSDITGDGHIDVSPSTTTTYTMTCQNNDGTGTGSAEATVRVIKPIIFEN